MHQHLPDATRALMKGSGKPACLSVCKLDGRFTVHLLPFNTINLNQIPIVRMASRYPTQLKGVFPFNFNHHVPLHRSCHRLATRAVRRWMCSLGPENLLPRGQQAFGSDESPGWREGSSHQFWTAPAIASRLGARSRPCLRADVTTKCH